MICPAKWTLEAVVLILALTVVRSLGGPRRHRFRLGFAGLTIALNLVFYPMAAWPLYESYGQAAGIRRTGLQALILFDIVKWGVLAYVLAGFAAALQVTGQRGGFALHRENPRWRSVLATGLLAGIAASAVTYALSHLEYRLGIFDAVPWPYFKESPLYLKLGAWGGLRNLAGEEILARLGAQSLLLYAMRRFRGAPLLAVLLSSLFFEVWHNNFRDLFFMNFAASCAFGWAYHKRGYESAALAHAVADWLILVILPRVLY